MWWKVPAAPAISCWVAASAVSAVKTPPPASQIWVSILRNPVETNVPSVPALARVCTGISLSFIPSSDEDFHPLPFTHATHPPTIFWTCSQIHSKPPAAAERTFLAGETQRKIHMEQHALQLASQVNKIRACSRFAATALRKVFKTPLPCECFCCTTLIKVSSSKYLPKALSPCLKIDMRLEVSDKRRCETVAVRDIKGQSWNILQIQTDLACSFLAASHQCTTLPPKYYRQKNKCRLHYSCGKVQCRVETPLHPHLSCNSLGEEVSGHPSGSAEASLLPSPELRALWLHWHGAFSPKNSFFLTQRSDGSFISKPSESQQKAWNLSSKLSVGSQFNF